MAHVLIIDDDKQGREMLRMTLEMREHHVTDASDGAKGIKAFRQEPADVVLCDLFMPEMDGLEVIQALKRDASGAKVIAMSGGAYQGRLDVLRVAELSGVAGVLQKHLGLEDALQAVEHALRGRTLATGHGTRFRRRRPGTSSPQRAGRQDSAFGPGTS